MIINRVKQDYDLLAKEGYEVVGVFLYGSQNYNLHYSGSDIDTKAIVLPTFDSFVNNKKAFSHTKVLESTEHVDIKDIRVMFECFKKQNINFLEILFTKYKVINPKYQELFQPILDNRESIARFNNYAGLKCIVGMIKEKRKALTHPYPSIKDKIDKYGYDPKQLHHIIRCNELLTKYLDGVPYADCLISSMPDSLINIKRTAIFNLKEAIAIADVNVNDAEGRKAKYMENNPVSINNDVTELMHNTLTNILKARFKEEFLSEG